MGSKLCSYKNEENDRENENAISNNLLNESKRKCKYKTASTYPNYGPFLRRRRRNRLKKKSVHNDN